MSQVFMEPVLPVGGYLVVHVGPDVSTVAVRATLEGSLVRGKSWMKMRVPKVVTVRALYVGPASVLAHAKDLIRTDAIESDRWTTEHMAGPSDLDIFNEPGVAALRRLCTPGCVTTIAATWPNAGKRSRDYFRRLLEARAPAGALVVLLEHCARSEWDRLSPSLESCVEIVQCEARDGATTAYATNFSGNSVNRLWGVKPAMMSWYLKDGRPRHKTDLFISASAEEREMYKLREEGKTLEEIGTVMGLNKSTIKRRLDKLR